MRDDFKDSNEMKDEVIDLGNGQVMIRMWLREETLDNLAFIKEELESSYNHALTDEEVLNEIVDITIAKLEGRFTQ